MPASPFISTALYIRLSVEDNNKRGNSIETQKLVLEKFLLGKPELRLYDIYIDNGATGTNFNRDGFQRMLSDIESGKVGCVIVKDLSRLGRNYIEAGSYIEIFFPKHNVTLSGISLPIMSGSSALRINLTLKTLIISTVVLSFR